MAKEAAESSELLDKSHPKNEELILRVLVRNLLTRRALQHVLGGRVLRAACGSV